MKRILFTILILGFTAQLANSQAFESRLINNGFGYLEYQMREITGVNPPLAGISPITDITFTVRWSTSLGDPLEINLLCGADYNMIEGFPTAMQQGSYYYKLFGCDPIPVYPLADWLIDEWQTICTMKISNPTSGTGAFEIAPNGFIMTNINFSYDSDGDNIPEEYNPAIASGVPSYPYPTVVYDRVWTGAATNRWNLASNWANECGGAGTIPANTNNVIIPLITDPEAFYPTTATANLTCKSLTIGEGGYMEVPGGATARTLTVTQGTVVKADGQLVFMSGTSTVQATGTLQGTLELKPSSTRAAGVMIINPYAKVTVSGATTLSAPGQLQLIANANSTGSFIDNGTINYVSGGSASVQTYVKNLGAAGAYYAHLVGPTVSNPAFQTQYGYPGVYLSQFDFNPLGTYSYEYSEPINNWVNIFQTNHPVRSTKGILISTIDATNYVMTMTGQLVTGALNTAPLAFGVNNLDLLSNPYASSLDFTLMFNANNTKITNKYYVYDPAAGTYKWFIVSGGGSAGVTKNIQIGQGFFVETLNNNALSLNNTMRLHSTATFFKDEFAYQLRLHVAGNSFADETHVFFKPEGTSMYDQLHDVYKWFSLQPEATEVWTVGADQSVLSLNSMPPLASNTVSVPMGFKCGAEGTYTITAENMGSFDEGTLIYLEDIVTGAQWHDLVANPVYEFTGAPGDDQNRFVIHFFGPTGINDPESDGMIDVYAWGQDAYIVNRGSETVKEYVVYDLMGRELHRGTLPNGTVNKVTIGDVSAYYIVKVITKEGRIYNDKVYITK